MIGKIILGIMIIYLLTALYFGVIKKTKSFGVFKKLLKLLIFIIIIGIALILIFPTLRG